MRRVGLALLLLLAAATPALGDDAGRKHHIDSQIATLQNTLTGQRKHEQALRGEVAGYTARIRALESRVGDVSLRLQTLEEDLALHQKRLDALNALFHVPFGTAGAGARITGAAPGIRFALAIAAASRAAAATPSFVSVCEAANPHAPLTSARMPMPIESLSPTCTICFSRVPTKFCR